MRRSSVSSTLPALFRRQAAAACLLLASSASPLFADEPRREDANSAVPHTGRKQAEEKLDRHFTGIAITIADLEARYARSKPWADSFCALKGEKLFMEVSRIDCDSAWSTCYIAHERSKAELARLVSEGYGSRHPKIEAINVSLKQTTESLTTGAKNYQETARLNLIHIQQALESLRKKAETETPLFAGGPRREDANWAVFFADRKQAEEKLDRHLTGIAESVRAQERIVMRRRAKMLQLMKDHRIIDPDAFPRVPLGTILILPPGPAFRYDLSKFTKLKRKYLTLRGDARVFANLKGDQLYQAITALGMDRNIGALHMEYEKARSEMARLVGADGETRHPPPAGLKASLPPMEKLLAAAAENYEKTAAIELAALREIIEKAEQETEDGGSPVPSPEVMNQYTEERTQWEIACAMRDKLLESALDMTKAAIGAFQWEVEHITGEAAHPPVPPTPADK